MRPTPVTSAPVATFDELFGKTSLDDPTPPQIALEKLDFDINPNHGVRPDAYPVRSDSVPKIIETPPPPPSQEETANLSYGQQGRLQERGTRHDQQHPLPAQFSGSQASPPVRPTGRQPPLILQAQTATKNAQTLNDMASHPSPLPGNTTRTDSLSFIPTFDEK